MNSRYVSGSVILALSLFAGSPTAVAESNALPDNVYPVWLRLLKWVSGDSNETRVPLAEGLKDPHMQMAAIQPAKPGDAEKAALLVGNARQVVRRYADVAVAERDGYRRFGGEPKTGDEVHYVNVGYSHAESQAMDAKKPGALLYHATPNGMRIVGVMYSARGDASPAELDGRAPLSIAHWHRHVNFCGAAVHTPANETDGPHARFGLQGSIHTQEACAKANGLWLPIAFGWMTHVYPDAKAAGVWGGEHMKPSGVMGGHQH